MRVMVPPEGMGVAGVKARVTGTHGKRATRSDEAMVTAVVGAAVVAAIVGIAVVGGAVVVVAVVGVAVVLAAVVEASVAGLLTWFPTKLDRITFWPPPLTKNI